MKHKLKHIAIWSLIISAFFIVVLIFQAYHYDSAHKIEDRYLTDYKYAAVINASNIPCDYAEFIEKNKNTEYYTEYRVIDDVPRIELTGDGIVYTFYPDVHSYYKSGKDTVNQNTNEYRLLKIVITDDSYRFGKKKIGVGSTRTEVEEAYRDNMKCYEVEGLGKGYIDGSWLYVRFLYDKEDNVTQISLFKEL